MIPYSEQPKVEVLYQLFSKDRYDPKISGVLPNSVFQLNPLFISKKQEFVVEYVQEEKPFILSGPEYNNL